MTVSTTMPGMTPVVNRSTGSREITFPPQVDEDGCTLQSRPAMSRSTSSVAVISGRIRKIRTEEQKYGSFHAVNTVNITEDVVPPQSRQSTVTKDLTAVCAMIVKPMNVLLLTLPPAMISQIYQWSDESIFGLNFLAILPLAGLLGNATEELAASVGDTLGGLLNATFGNAVEMILAFYALREGLVDVVQGSLLGSILSNLLLVLGMCFLLGGCTNYVQKFNPDGARVQSSMLLLAVLALAVPTIVAMQSTSDRHTSDSTAVEADKRQPVLDESLPFEIELRISRCGSIILGVIYLLYLRFQLISHAEYFTGDIADEDEEYPAMSAVSATLMLLVCTVIVAICSEGLVGSVEGLTERSGISRGFIGVVLLPIVGNAAEHATAVTVAVKDKMDLALGVALGSSTQIALFVVPFTVLAGWQMNIPMDLNFRPVATGILLLTVLIVCVITSDGQSNWMQGAMLLAAYSLIASTFWFVV